MGHHDGGVGEGVQERPELLEVLGRLENPTLSGMEPLQDLEHRLHVGVVGGLVVGEVVVAPPRGPGHPLEGVAREVRHLQLDLLVHVVGLHRVHGRHERRRGLHRLPGAVATGPARVHPVDLGRVLRVWHGLVGLPEGHRTEPGVRGQQVDQVGGARPRQPDDDDRPRRWGSRGSRDAGSAGRGREGGWRRSGRSRRTSSAARSPSAPRRRPSLPAGARAAPRSPPARSPPGRCAPGRRHTRRRP